jgi:predicted HTH transcriptional regulator
MPGSNPDEPGWTSFDPPFDTDYLLDKEGNYHEVKIEQKEICPRCNSDLSRSPLQRIFVSTTTTLDDIRPIIQQGEGVQIEFMVKYPDNAHELAKEIAAFSTTQGGKVFLGVKDDGSIVGLKDIDTPKRIDDLSKRIRGVAGKINPKVDISVDMVSEKEIHVAIITVRKGTMPFYECEGKAYIRELDASRPATYDEKIRLHSNWHEKRQKRANKNVVDGR